MQGQCKRTPGIRGIMFVPKFIVLRRGLFLDEDLVVAGFHRSGEGGGSSGEEVYGLGGDFRSVGGEGQRLLLGSEVDEDSDG